MRANEVKIINKFTNDTIKNIESGLLPLLSAKVNPLIEKHNLKLNEFLKKLEDRYFNWIEVMDSNSEERFNDILEGIYEYTSNTMVEEKDKVSWDLITNKGIEIQFQTMMTATNGFRKRKDGNKYHLTIELKIKECINKITSLINNYYVDGICNNYNTLRESFMMYNDMYCGIKEEIERADAVEETIEEIVDEVINNRKKEKIFTYRDMDKYMKKNGFEVIRYNGDHAIYSNGKISIPVPARVIGKSLSFTIQKQINLCV